MENDSLISTQASLAKVDTPNSCLENNLNKDKIDIVLYHGHCSDGYGSAFVVWLYYKYHYGLDNANAIKYIPCYYQKEPNLAAEFLSDMSGKNILMCDFSYKYEQLLQLISVANTFMILDHHKTAEANLKKIPDNLKVFDMKRSGAGITWDFFYPNDKLPTFLEYIQDRDIWSNKFRETAPFVAFFYEQEFNFELWETYLEEQNVVNAIEIGNNWLGYQKILMDKIIKKTSYVIQEINNQYSIVLYSNSSELKSDIGNKVFRAIPIGDFSCVWDYNLYTNQSSCSLRSTDDRYDVSAIATNFGGGGHRNASGCLFVGPFECLPYTKVEDPGILALLLHGSKDTVNIANREQNFVLFKVKDQIRPEWISGKYFDLIKRKYIDCVFIVFETQSNSVDINRKTGEIIRLREYNMFFNEKTTSDPEKRLQIMACCSKDHALTFTSTKDFTAIFDEFVNDGNDCPLDADSSDNNNNNDNDDENFN